MKTHLSVYHKIIRCFLPMLPVSQFGKQWYGGNFYGRENSPGHRLIVFLFLLISKLKEWNLFHCLPACSGWLSLQTVIYFDTLSNFCSIYFC